MCPSCGKATERTVRHAADLESCGACGVRWLSAQALKVFLSRAERHFVPQDLAALRADCVRRRVAAAAAAFRSTAQQLACPVCAQPLSPRAFGGISGVTAQQCAPHGLLVTSADFDHIEDFLRRGGELLTLEQMVAELRAKVAELTGKVREAEQVSKRRG